MNDADIERLLTNADALITEAESLFSDGKTEDAAEKLYNAADELSRAGIHITEYDKEECADAQRCAHGNAEFEHRTKL